MPHPRALLVFVFVVAGLLSGLSAQTPAAPSADSPLHRGTLPNGLRYAVLPHASAKGDLALRLIVQAGSLDERDDERGFAHFVEHMAFNGTRNFPPGTLVGYFQRLGLTFGADLNASTTFTHTQYLLDLPDGRAGRLDEALLVLRDYADGVLFDPEEVKKESRVVLSELRARDNAGRRTAIQMLQALYGGTRLPEREPTGEPAQLEAATPEQLRAFYRRNYLPSRMTVLVVGPVDVAATVAKISATFGSMAAPGEIVAPAPVPQPAPVTSLKPEVVVVPTAKAARVEYTFIRPRPADTVEGHREELVQRVATSALQRRLRARREADVADFGEANASYTAGPAGSLIHHSIVVSSGASNSAGAVQLAETELRRARNGFTQAEVDEIVATQLNDGRNRIASEAGHAAARRANDLARFLALQRNWQTAEADLAEATTALRGLTAAEVTAALQEIFPPDALRLVLMIPPENEMKPDRLLALHTRSAGRALRRSSADEEQLVFRYENFGAPGQIAKRERVDDLDLTLVSFANGARLNVRPTKFEPERFRLRVVFPQNLSNVPEDRGGIADLAGHLLLQSNLGKHKQPELVRLIRLHGITPQFSVNFGTPVLTIGGPAAELPFALQFLAALLSDLDFDLEHYRVALSRYAGQHRTLMLNAGPLALREAVRVFTGNDRRVVMHPAQSFALVSPDEAQDWLRKHILNGPLEVGIVGDVAVDEAVATAAASIGALKRRATVPKAGALVAAPQKPTRQEGVAELPASTSMSCILWPVTLPDDPRSNAALALASDVLRERMMLVLREHLGISYAPNSAMHRDLIQRDFAFAAVINTFDPARAQQFTEGNVRLAARLAERGVTPGEFERLREPARARHAAHLHDNGWWLDQVVSLAQSRPTVQEIARQHGKVIDELTLEEVNAAAQVYKSDRVTAMILRPAAAGAPEAKAGNPKSGAKKN